MIIIATAEGYLKLHRYNILYYNTLRFRFLRREITCRVSAYILLISKYVPSRFFIETFFPRDKIVTSAAFIFIYFLLTVAIYYIVILLSVLRDAGRH